MSTTKEHIIKAKHNLDLVNKLDSSYLDWQITAYFYAALHRVHAVMHFVGYGDDQFKHHQDVVAAVETNLPGSVSTAYESLLSLSYLARYRADIILNLDSFNIAQQNYISIVNACEQLAQVHMESSKV